MGMSNLVNSTPETGGLGVYTSGTPLMYMLQLICAMVLPIQVGEQDKQLKLKILHSASSTLLIIGRIYCRLYLKVIDNAV